MKFSSQLAIRNDKLIEAAASLVTAADKLTTINTIQTANSILNPPKVGHIGVYGVYSPHSNTTRETYTVPADKIIKLRTACITVEQLDNVGVDGRFHAMFRVDSSLNPQVPVALLSSQTEIEGAGHAISVPIDLWLEEGGRITFETGDASAAGEKYYDGKLFFEIYDAP